MSADHHFTPGRFVLAGTDAVGARDGAGLLAQCKYMRRGMEKVGAKPALILVVVDEPELDAAQKRIKDALEPLASDEGGAS
jgi:hypothetical protein